MIDEETRNRLLEEIRSAILENRLPAWETTFSDNYEEMFEKEGVDFEDYLEEMINEAEEGGDDEETRKRAAKAAATNVLGKYVKYGNKKFKYENLFDMDLSIVNPSPYTLKNWEKALAALDDLIVAMEILGAGGQNAVKKIIEKLDEDIAIPKDKDEIREIEATLEDVFRGIAETDLTQAKDRKKFYRFWHEVNKEYPKLEDAIDAVKEAAERSRLPKEIKAAYKKLELPPNYIVKLAMIKHELEHSEIRVINFLKTLAQTPEQKRTFEAALKKPTTYELGVFREDVEPFRGEKIRPRQRNVPSGGQVSVRGKHANLISQEELEYFEDMENVEMDPLLWHEIDESDWLQIPVAADEIGKVEEHMESLIEIFGEDTSLGRKFHDKLQDLIKEAGESLENMYLPVTPWLEELKEKAQVPTSEFGHTTDINILDRIDELNKDTSKFFELIGDIFLTGDIQLPISMDPQHPTSKPQMYAGPALAGKGQKPQPKGFRQPRAQGFTRPTKRKEGSKRLQKLENELVKSLNRYYFVPLGKGYFVDGEKPEFYHDMKGRFPYRNIRFALGTSPDVWAEKKLVKGVAEHIDFDSIKRLTEYFSQISTKIVQTNVKEYSGFMDEIVEDLNEIFEEMPGHDRLNTIWAGWDIGNMVKKYHEGDVDLNSIEFRGRTVGELHKEYEKSQGVDYPMEYLRGFLKGDSLSNLLRRKHKYGGSQFKKLQEEIDKLLELSDPNRINKLDPINGALLNVYDSIRKMKGKKIVKGNIYLMDIRGMDYIINRVEEKYNVEINAMEVETIVKSIDSISSLSNNYGLKEDVIYEIKGLCR